MLQHFCRSLYVIGKRIRSRVKCLNAIVVLNVFKRFLQFDFMVVDIVDGLTSPVRAWMVLSTQRVGPPPLMRLVLVRYNLVDRNKGFGGDCESIWVLEQFGTMGWRFHPASI